MTAETQVQHTPGPWMTHGPYVITGNEAGPIDARTIEDARLIAAAPALLAALEALRLAVEMAVCAALEANVMLHPDLIKTFDAAGAAIAEATHQG